MSQHTFRYYESPKDLEAQYALWLKATEHLPRAWLSSLVNVRAISTHLDEHPTARIYAHDSSSELVGYVGTHPPFEWPPLGCAMPFGFPWTFPEDDALAAELYERAIAVTPQTYAGQRRDVYIQRFRVSWPRHIEFLTSRGWREAYRYALLGRDVAEIDTSRAPIARAVGRDELAAIAAFAASDAHAKDRFDVDTLARNLDRGWLHDGGLYVVENVGAFALEVRGGWAHIQFLYTGADVAAYETLTRSIAATAQAAGAAEIYYTVEPAESARRAALEACRFHALDAGVYLICGVQR